MQGISEKTELILKALSNTNFIKDYALIGGTALSLQINKRISEDLDFCLWSKNLKNDKPEVNRGIIEKELSKIGTIEKSEILGFDQVDFQVNSVKLTFMAKQHNLSPVTRPVKLLNNIVLADVNSIGIMKMEVLLRRSIFRDYYDIYSILKEGHNLKELAVNASKYSNHTISSKNIISLLLNADNFKTEKDFNKLNPFYKINAKDIESYIRSIVTNIKIDNSFKLKM